MNARQLHLKVEVVDVHLCVPTPMISYPRYTRVSIRYGWIAKNIRREKRRWWQKCPWSGHLSGTHSPVHHKARPHPLAQLVFAPRRRRSLPLLTFFDISTRWSTARASIPNSL